MSDSQTTFKIHPSIGIARLGNTDDNFYLSPEQPGALPIECDDMGAEKQDKNGKPKRVKNFKDSGDLSLVKKQAARFKIFAYQGPDDDSGQEIEVGGTYNFIKETGATAPTIVQGTVTDIDWTVHLANKKASWYNFQENDGSEGYGPDHPLRNPTVTQPDLRRQLIIDPGPIVVNLKNNVGYCAKFGTDVKAADNSKNRKVSYPQTFPPADIKPNSIDTLGTLKVNKQNKNIRLVVLGGNGNSGSSKTPVITSFVNNDGWFDDISDGPVTASISYSYEQTTYNGDTPVVTQKTGSMDVQVPAWVVVGYPRFAPQMMDMITLEEKMFDLYVRKSAYRPEIFGVAPYDRESNNPQTEEELELWRNSANYNPDYYPKFYEQLWPIFKRPNEYVYSLTFDPNDGGDPHNRGTGGNLDQKALSQVPTADGDPYKRNRMFIEMIMREPDELNKYTIDGDYNPTSSKMRLMPMLCGNNPISNTSPEKFLSMSKTQLFFIKQWAKGKFVNECAEWGEDNANCEMPWSEPPTRGQDIDRGVLSNLLGGAFCPGGELSWIVNNIAIYSEPFRIKHATYQAGGLSLPAPIAAIDGSQAPNLAKGLEPGDLTKYIGIPWQADFHECTTQTIDITYDGWNKIYTDSTGDPVQDQQVDIPWWPAHRPMVVFQKDAQGNPGQVYWTSGIPNNMAGDLQMVQAWKDLGFLLAEGTGNTRAFYQQERNDAALGEPIAPGDRILGQSEGVTSKKQ